MKINGECILISGPTRGGKSKWAESLLSSDEAVTYIATSNYYSTDRNWYKRVKEHRRRRPSHWKLIESKINLSNDIKRANKNHSLLIDSLGGFVTRNLMQTDKLWDRKSINLIRTIATNQQKIIIVVEEVAWGVVPSTKIGCLFRDRIGLLSQQLHEISNQSWLVVQGRPINMNKLVF